MVTSSQNTPFSWVLRRWTVGLLLLCACRLTAQNASNPFEIATRLPQTTATGEVVAAGPVNPFDVAPHEAPGAATSLLDSAEEDSDADFQFEKGGNTLPRQFEFWVLVVLSMFFTLAIAANRGALLKAWRSFLSDNSMNLAQREAAGFVGSTPYFLMYGSFLLQAGTFVFLVVQAFNRGGEYHNLTFFLLCLMGAAVLFLGKHVLLGVVGWLFPKAAPVISRYNFLIIVFNCVLGFFLLPFNFLVAFAGSDDQRLFLTLWTLGLASIFLAYQSLRALALGLKFLAGNQFHFLLYLCSVEIAPVLLLVKLFI